MHCRHVQAQIDTRKNTLQLLLLLCKLPKSPVPLKPAGVEGILDLGGLGFQANCIQLQDYRFFKSTGQILLSLLQQKELL